MRGEKHRHRVFVIHVVQFQYLFGPVVHRIMQNGEQQVLFVYFVGSLDTGLQYGQFQYVASLLVQYEVGRVYGRV